MLKHGTVRVHDQHDLGDDEDEDQPADWWMAVATEGSSETGYEDFRAPILNPNTLTEVPRSPQADSAVSLYRLDEG